MVGLRGHMGRDKMERVNETRQRMIVAREKTLKEVANLLHAQVQSRLLVLQYWLKDCQDLLRDAPPAVVDRLDDARKVLGEIIDEDLRSITRHLYPSIIRVGLPSALNSLADRFQSMFELEIDVDNEVADMESSMSSGIKDDVRLALYRVVEEALTNVAKHSRADRVVVRLGIPSGREMELVIEDNGRGVDPQNVLPGLGLLSMTDYVEALGGHLEIQSVPDQGTKISVRVTIETEARPLAVV